MCVARVLKSCIVHIVKRRMRPRGALRIRCHTLTATSSTGTWCKGSIHLILCLALLCVSKDRHQCRSSPTFLVLYGSGFCWSCVRSLRQSSEVGPGYTRFYLGGLVGFDEGGRWAVSYT